jgi:hypothetical protein
MVVGTCVWSAHCWQGSAVKTGRLISASSTTGWADWIHGNLWLFPHGLLRVRTSLRSTIGDGIIRTTASPPPTRVFAEEEIARLADARSTNLWIPASSIVSSSFRRGAMTSRLGLKLADGREIKLLWLRRDPAERELRSALEEWGGPAT